MIGILCTQHDSICCFPSSYKYHPKRIHCGPLAPYDPSSSSIYIYIDNSTAAYHPATATSPDRQPALKVLFGRSFRGYHQWNGFLSPGLSVTLNHANMWVIQNRQNLPGLSHELPAPGSPIHRLCRQLRRPRTVATEFISSVHTYTTWDDMRCIFTQRIFIGK